MDGGYVIDFLTWKEEKMILLMNEPCEKPFHRGEYVVEDHCRRCDKDVELAKHPSFEHPRWYG